MTPERLAEIREWSNRYASQSGWTRVTDTGLVWTGTTGTAAAMIRELLDEIDKLNNPIMYLSRCMVPEERDGSRH